MVIKVAACLSYFSFSYQLKKSTMIDVVERRVTSAEATSKIKPYWIREFLHDYDDL